MSAIRYDNATLRELLAVNVPAYIVSAYVVEETPRVVVLVIRHGKTAHPQLFSIITPAEYTIMERMEMAVQVYTGILSQEMLK